MIRLRVLLGTVLVLGAIIASFVNAQLSDEEKETPEVRAKAHPNPTATPKPKPKPAKRKAKSTKKSGAKPKPTATAKKSPTPEPDETSAAKNKAKAQAKETEDENEDESSKSKTTKKSGVKKTPTPTPEVEESPEPKSKAKSGSKKSGNEEEDEDETPKPKPARKRAVKKTATPAGKESPEKKAKSGTKKSEDENEDEEQTPAAKSTTKKGGDKKEATKKAEESEPAKTPVPVEKPVKIVPEPAQAPTPQPSPRPRPVVRPPLPQAVLPPDITVEKSGLEKEQGLEPPPPPPPRRGFWGWARQPANYKYLTSANIDAIRKAPVQKGRWKFIIVHNSGTRQGSAKVFDYYHRKIRRMRNGLAYHFVIGNGTSTRDGQIEIGDRWRLQKSGGHVHSDYMNNIGLGICLVGDFNRDQPTKAQLEATDELIRYLQERCGKSDGRSLIVRPHREVNPPRWSTDCPGDAFPYGWFGRFR